MHQTDHVGMEAVCGEEGVGGWRQLTSGDSLIKKLLNLGQAGGAVGFVFRRYAGQFLGEFTFVKNHVKHGLRIGMLGKLGQCHQCKLPDRGEGITLRSLAGLSQQGFHRESSALADCLKQLGLILEIPINCSACHASPLGYINQAGMGDTTLPKNLEGGSKQRFAGSECGFACFFDHGCHCPVKRSRVQFTFVHVCLYDDGTLKGQGAAMHRLSAGFVLGVSVLLAACGQEEAAQPSGGMPPPAQVTIEIVEPHTVPINFEYVGRLEASREVEIRPRVAAVIERRYFEEGAPVKAGARLYKLDAASIAAQARAAGAELANRKALHAQARLELERNQMLAAQGFVSARALDVTQTALAVTDAGVRAAQANLTDARVNLGYTDIHAPLSGVMGRALQVEGALVSPTGPALTTLAQISPIYARFSIGEDARLALEKQREDGTLEQGRQRVALVLADGTRIDAKGKLNFSDYKANPQTGAFDMRAEFTNADGNLKPGQFVRAIVEGGKLPDAISVPQPAVQDGPTGKFVYVASPGEKGMTVALPRPVEVGPWIGSGEPGKGQGRWVIFSGLKPGDKVVVVGMARIFFPGMPITPSVAGAPAVTPPAKPAAAVTPNK